jgi:hypothetical protein
MIAREKEQAARLFLMPKPAPPPDSELPNHSSPSSLNLWMSCQAKYLYKKVLKLPEQRSGALALGTAVHAAVIGNLQQKIESKRDMTLRDTQAIFVSSLCDQIDEGITLQGEEQIDDIKETGEGLVQLFQDRVASTLQPVAVEEEVHGMIGDVDVRGFIDVRDIHGRILDIKTAKRKPSGISHPHMTQLATYGILHPEASGVVQIITLTKGKTLGLHQDTAELTESDKRLTTRLYSLASDQQQTGLYAPNRASTLCSKRYCGFWKKCIADFGGTVPGEVEA